MKFERKSLTKAIAKVAKATGNGALTKNIKFEVMDGTATFTGFDEAKHVKIVTSIPVVADEKENIATLIEAAMLKSYVDKISADEVEIVIDKVSATIKAGRVKASLPVGDAEAYPTATIGEVGENAISLSYATLKDLASVSFACSTNDSNQIMTAVNVKLASGKLTFTALDGHRVARKYASIEDTKSSVEINIAATLLKAALDAMDQTKSILLKVGENAIEFSDGTTTAAIALVSGKYFDVDRLISSSAPAEGAGTKVTIKVGELAETIGRMELFINEAVKKPVIFEITEGEMKASVTTTRGNNEESIETVVAGKALRIGFNVRLIGDTLKNIEDETITMEFGPNGKSPVIIRKDAKAGYLFLVLPVNIVEVVR